MIFRTITDESTGAAKSIGIFGKSLSELKTIFSSIKANGIIKTFFNTSTIDKKAVIDYNAEIEKAIANNATLAEKQQIMQSAMKGTNKVTAQLIGATNGATVSTDALTAAQHSSTIAAKAQATALKAASIAGNMILFTAIAKGIQLATTAIDNWIHRVEKANKAIKAATDSAKSFSDTIKDIQKETVDMEKSVDSIIDRYAKLSQGVNTFTNENQSLPTDQYEEFLELNKQLTGLFPSLTRNYDENGNAILGLSGSVDSVTESIRSLVEQEKELARAQIRENLEQYFEGTDEADGAWKALEGRKQKLEEANEALTTLKNTYEGLINADVSTVVGQYHKNFVGKEQAKYIEYIKDNFGKDIAESMEDAISIHLGKGLNGQFADLVVDFSSLELTETQKEQIARSYDTFYSELLAKQKTAMSEFDSQNSEFSNNALLWLEDLSFYKESDKYIQTAIQNLVRNIDWSNYDFKELDYDGVKRILQDSILTPFQVACDDPNAKKSLDNALKGLFTMDTNDMAVGDITAQVDSYISTIATAIGENPAELKVRLGFDDTDTQPLINNVRSKLQDEFDDRVGELKLKELQIAAEQIEVPENALLSWDELIDKIKEVQSSTLNNENPISLFTQLTTSKDALDKFQSSVKNAADAYSTLMSGNYSSTDLLDSLQAINEAVTDMGGSLDWEFIDYMGDSNLYNSLELLGGAIEHITEKYAESVLSGAGIDVDSKFGQMLANNIIQAQKASTQLEVLNDQIDSLQSAYSNLTDIVDTYNETGYITFDQLQTLLEMEPQYLSCLVDENGQLQLNEAAMAELANRRLDDAEAQAIQQAITELGQIALQDEKQAVQENAEAFTSAVNDLANYNTELANTIAEATVGAAAIRELNAAINGAEAQGTSDTQINTVLDNLNAKLQLIGNVRDKVASGGLGSVVKSGSSSGSKSSSKKDTTKEFDWIEQAIENVEKEVKNLDDIVNSAYSTFSQKNEALAQEIGKVTEEIDLQQKAYDEYMRKADSISLSDEYKTLIRDGAINIENISDEKLQEKISEYQQWYEKAVDASDAISELSTKVKDLHVKGYELQTDRLEELLENEAITEKQYISEMTRLYKQYYENQTDYAVQAHKAKMALLNKEKSYLNSVANAAASLFDKEINKVQDNAKEQAKVYKAQIKEAEKQKKIYQDQIKAEQKKIDAYNKEIDLINDKKKPLQDELDALEDKARQENLILDLQKKQATLAAAENQRTKLVNYMPDTIVI